MAQVLFATGMFRSGTTLLARMLDMHPEIALASDAFQPTLKAFRNAVAARYVPDRALDPDAPLDDYYFRPDKLALMRAIQDTPLDYSIGALPVESLREALAAYSHELSPKLLDHLHLVAGESFFDLMRTGIEAVERAYGGPETTVVGFKTTWSSEFVPHILDAFPTARAIEIVRDPRAVCASRKASVGGYPWLFLMRQWRKLAALAYAHAQAGPRHAGRVLVIRYEDLVLGPEHQARRICTFLDIPFHDALVRVEGFRDGDGTSWRGNSSHFTSMQRFDTAPLAKWRDVLSAEETEYIERLCLPEMGLFGYTAEQATDGRVPPTFVIDPPLLPAEALAGWIRKYDFAGHEVRGEMALEHWRVTVLADGALVPEEVKRACCLVPAVFDAIRAPDGALDAPAGAIKS
jgi:hypothetical protein